MHLHIINHLPLRFQTSNWYHAHACTYACLIHFSRCHYFFRTIPCIFQSSTTTLPATFSYNPQSSSIGQPIKPHSSHAQSHTIQSPYLDATSQTSLSTTSSLDLSSSLKNYVSMLFTHSITAPCLTSTNTPESISQSTSVSSIPVIFPYTSILSPIHESTAHLSPVPSHPFSNITLELVKLNMINTSSFQDQNTCLFSSDNCDQQVESTNLTPPTSPNLLSIGNINIFSNEPSAQTTTQRKLRNKKHKKKCNDSTYFEIEIEREMNLDRRGYGSSRMTRSS